MNTVFLLTKRNVKLFFKDKGMFFTSLITPAILLVLYITFLGNVYKDSFSSSLPESFNLSEKLINGLVGGEIISSILAVSCVTVAFCSNFLMVQDKVSGVLKDIRVSPVKPSFLSLSYYFANLISTLLICYGAAALCFVYLSYSGWYMTVADILLIISDITLLVLFGNAVSSVINFFLNSQGQISAVGTIVSSGYGFICGAYMPISSFGEGLQKVISCLPGTYGTALIRNHALQGAINELKNIGVPTEIIKNLKDSLDCNLYFFGNSVSKISMYAVIVMATVLFLALYIILNITSLKSKNKY